MHGRYHMHLHTQNGTVLHTHAERRAGTVDDIDLRGHVHRHRADDASAQLGY